VAKEIRDEITRLLYSAPRGSVVFEAGDIVRQELATFMRQLELEHVDRVERDYDLTTPEQRQWFYQRGRRQSRLW
jgi:hypothetical protein